MIAGIFGQRSSDPSEKRIESLRQDEAAPTGGSRPQLHGEGDAEGGLVQVVDGAAADGVEVGRGLVGVRHAVDLLDRRGHLVADSLGEGVVGRDGGRCDPAVGAENQLREGVPCRPQ